MALANAARKAKIGRSTDLPWHAAAARGREDGRQDEISIRRVAEHECPVRQLSSFSKPGDGAMTQHRTPVGSFPTRTGAQRTTSPGPRRASPLLGRDADVQLLDAALARLARGTSTAVEIIGEPGIGKTRMLSELARSADRRGWLVLSGSASELERDAPFSVFTDALDDYLRGLGPQHLKRLPEDVQAELTHVFPALASLASNGVVPLRHERYRAHRAVRALLEQLAATGPLVLALDDVHWADAASVELFGALLRRPPVAPVLLAMTLRPSQAPVRLAAALERAHRSDALTLVELRPLTPAESRQFLGDTFDAVHARVIYEESGGNPFYLGQLARSIGHAGWTSASTGSAPGGIELPAAITASLNDELALVPDGVRRVLDGAAVAGDPFELELATAAAGTPEPEAIDAIDQLLQIDLVRTTDVPRRFRFRHPLIRRAVYEATAGGWRLGAHERCARALEARGASAAMRAHHVERSARVGDDAAVAVLREAGESSLRLAPASAARWLGAALRLLPETAPPADRVEILQARANALTAAGYYSESRDALMDALAIAPDAMKARLTRACVAVESLLGRYEQAHDRIATALDVHSHAASPDLTSPDAVALRIELAMNGFWRARYAQMRTAAAEAVDAARGLGDQPLTAAALATLALADSITGAAERVEPELAEAASLVDSLANADVAQRLDSVAWVAGAELYLDRYREADGHAVRALAVGRDSGQGELFLVLVQILGRVWFVRGKLDEAAELLDGGIDEARLLGNTQALVWNLFNRSVVALAAGDIDHALSSAQESVDLSQDFAPGFHTAWAAVRLAGALLELGEPHRAVELLLGSCGGSELTLIPGSWRAYCLELLTRCWLALDQHAEASRAAECAHNWASAGHLPLAAAWAGRAAAAVALHAGDGARAAELALDSAVAADEVGAPIEAALSRALAGRSLAKMGLNDRAAAELERAIGEFERCGALRYRDDAERELRKLGRRIQRRTAKGTMNGTTIDSLTSRELQVARLVVQRKTNREIAAELFVSQKTVETHLRNIFYKLDVPSRVALARAVEHVERGARP
jgi:DNA-binding NarL/FixJ family response regulator/tetratricopeptide (TPR) repeat protein